MDSSKKEHCALAVQILSEHVIMIRQSQTYDLDSSADLTLQSEVSPTIVLHRTDKGAWESVSSIIMKYL